MTHARRFALVIGAAVLVAGCSGGRAVEPSEDPRSSGGGVRGDFQNARLTDLTGGFGDSSQGDGLTPVNLNRHSVGLL